MSPFGAVRQGKDTVADESDQRGHGVLTKVAQTNIFASQKGISAFGSVRHAGDIKVKSLWEDNGEYPTDDDDVPLVSRRETKPANPPKQAARE